MQESTSHRWITPNWPAPENVSAVTTTRIGGVSKGPYAGLNLGTHVEDNPQNVAKNREILSKTLNIHSIHWLNQTHSKIVVDLDENPDLSLPADGSFTTKRNQVCVAMTADCLPVLLTDAAGTVVAAVHCGWRSLQQEILLTTIDKMRLKSKYNILAWLGPAICVKHFEVGAEVKAQFEAANHSYGTAFTKINQDKYLANVYQLAKMQLIQKGVFDIFGGDYCTFEDVKQFYSYRRDNITGRMASLIWLE